MFVLLVSAAMLACSAPETGPDRTAACGPSGCPDLELLEVRDIGNARDESWRTGHDEHGTPVELRHVLTIDGHQIEAVLVSMDVSGRPAVIITLSQTGGEQLRSVSKNAIGNRLAIMANGKVILSPYVNGEFGSDFQVTTETLEEAQQLRQRLLNR